MIKNYFFFTLFFIFFFNPTANSNQNIAFIDINLILELTNFGKKITNEIDLLNNKTIDQINNMKKNLNILSDEINNNKNVVSKDVLDEKIRLLNKNIKSFNIEKDNLLEIFNKTKIEKKNDFLLKITPIIKDYMSNNSIDFLIEKNNIFVGRDKYNITEDIINEINNKIR